MPVLPKDRCFTQARLGSPTRLVNRNRNVPYCLGHLATTPHRGWSIVHQFDPLRSGASSLPRARARTLLSPHADTSSGRECAGAQRLFLLPTTAPALRELAPPDPCS